MIFKCLIIRNYGMKKLLLLNLLIFILSYQQNAYSKNNLNIITVSSIKEMIPYFDKTDQNTLVIFDIDSTLTTPSDQYLQRQTINNYKDTYENLTHKLTENQYRIFLHLIIMDSPSMLVEQETPIIIKKLQNNNVKLIGFTGSKFGALGTLPSFPEWRYQELQRLGIDFIDIFPGKTIFTEFYDLKGEHIGIEKGIVYSGYKNTKGSLLKKVLEELKLYPKQIMFIDDKKNNLISVLEASKSFLPKCQVIGFHYKGIELLPKATTNVKIFKKKIIKLIKKTQALSA